MTGRSSLGALDRFRDLLASTERMLEQARQTQAAGAAAVRSRLEALQTLRAEAQALAPHQGARPE
jgi:hypothetical protein